MTRACHASAGLFGLAASSADDGLCLTISLSSGVAAAHGARLLGFPHGVGPHLYGGD